jgi:L,D-peptidoglycan transpeptidase YkuD (ErfK/YbiS/YcfS/YnhG family)
MKARTGETAAGETAADETATYETWAPEATYVAPEATATKMAAAKAAHVAPEATTTEMATAKAAATYMSTAEAATAVPSKRQGIGRNGRSSECNTRRERDGQSPQPLQHSTSPFQRGRNPQTGCRFRQPDQIFLFLGVWAPPPRVGRILNAPKRDRRAIRAIV